MLKNTFLSIGYGYVTVIFVFLIKICQVSKICCLLYSREIKLAGD